MKQLNVRWNGKMMRRRMSFQYVSFSSFCQQHCNLISKHFIKPSMGNLMKKLQRCFPFISLNEPKTKHLWTQSHYIKRYILRKNLSLVSFFPLLTVAILPTFIILWSLPLLLKNLVQVDSNHISVMLIVKVSMSPSYHHPYGSCK